MNTYILGHASTMTERWRRDERTPVRASEHTHFPHAVLEVKLQGDVENPPRWVKDMISSGMVTEVHLSFKFERVCVDIYICMLECMHVCMYVCVYCMCACMYLYVQVRMYVCMHAHVHLYSFATVYACMHECFGVGLRG